VDKQKFINYQLLKQLETATDRGWVFFAATIVIVVLHFSLLNLFVLEVIKTRFGDQFMCGPGILVFSEMLKRRSAERFFPL
jgi:hypothetical protein